MFHICSVRIFLAMAMSKLVFEGLWNFAPYRDNAPIRWFHSYAILAGSSKVTEPFCFIMFNNFLQLVFFLVVCFLVWCRILGGVGDEQRRSWISPVHLHDQPSSWPATPPSGWWRGGDGRGSGARPFIILNPQWRHGEDPAGRPARVEPQQLVLRQVGLDTATGHLLKSEESDACWASLSVEFICF